MRDRERQGHRFCIWRETCIVLLMASQRSGERGRGAGFRRQDGSSGVLQKLQTNPVFQKSRVADPSSFESVRPRIPLQLLAYDGRGHLFVWNSQEKLLHFVDVQHSDSSRSGNTSNSASLLSKKDFKVCSREPLGFRQKGTYPQRLTGFRVFDSVHDSEMSGFLWLCCSQ